MGSPCSPPWLWRSPSTNSGHLTHAMVQHSPLFSVLLCTPPAALLSRQSPQPSPPPTSPPSLRHPSHFLRSRLSPTFPVPYLPDVRCSGTINLLQVHRTHLCMCSYPQEPPWWLLLPMRRTQSGHYCPVQGNL